MVTERSLSGRSGRALPVRDRRRGDRIDTDFAALRSVANGTKRTSSDVCPFVRFRGEADMPRPRPAYHLVAFDPQLTWAGSKSRTAAATPQNGRLVGMGPSAVPASAGEAKLYPHT
jgi:hypothetical protein